MLLCTKSKMDGKQRERKGSAGKLRDKRLKSLQADVAKRGKIASTGTVTGVAPCSIYSEEEERKQKEDKEEEVEKEKDSDNEYREVTDQRQKKEL